MTRFILIDFFIPWLKYRSYSPSEGSDVSAFQFSSIKKQYLYFCNARRIQTTKHRCCQ